MRDVTTHSLNSETEHRRERSNLLSFCVRADFAFSHAGKSKLAAVAVLTRGGTEMESATFDLYRDIAERTDGDVYLGVVGPVRTGKSTFITA